MDAELACSDYFSPRFDLRCPSQFPPVGISSSLIFSVSLFSPLPLSSLHPAYLLPNTARALLLYIVHRCSRRTPQLYCIWAPVSSVCLTPADLFRIFAVCLLFPFMLLLLLSKQIVYIDVYALVYTLCLYTVGS